MNDLQSQFDEVLKQWRSGAIDDAAAAVHLMLVAGLHDDPEDAVGQLMTSAPPRIVAAIEQLSQSKVKVEAVEELGILRLKRF
jgi:hypothetical protein